MTEGVRGNFSVAAGLTPGVSACFGNRFFGMQTAIDPATVTTS
jgi:hypothetical protein